MYRTLQGIAQGQLIIEKPLETYYFPAKTDNSQLHVSAVATSSRPKATIVLKNRRFFLRLVASPDLGFAEAYMFGDIDVEPDQLVDVFRIFILNSRTKVITSFTTSALTRIFSIPARVTVGRFVASLQNAQPNISAHYDLGNDIFAAFLSKDMTYSCAIFPSLDADLKLGESGPAREGMEDDLHNAQMRKLRHIIEKADIRPGHRVLEIGSGWGSLSCLIAETIENTTIETITLSVQQADYVQNKLVQDGLTDRVRVHLMDYRAMPLEWQGAFDRVVSIEMIEAVGKEFYETYFAKIDWALKKDTGVAVIQGITIPEARDAEYVKTEDFIRKWVRSYCKPLIHVFPGGILPTVTQLTSAVVSAASGRLLVESINNIGPHYARTLREWRRRFEAGIGPSVITLKVHCTCVTALRDEFPDVMQGARGREEIEVFRRKWIYYFCYCEVGFTMRLLGVHILTLTREGNADYGCKTFA
ncbi:CFS1-like protein [Trametopsis cervina]|nr:CFS1-like protein [Trametopsis cervina]